MCRFLVSNSVYLQLAKLIETLEKQLTDKGNEINGYIAKHNIQVQGKKDQTSTDAAPAADSKSSGVLVSSGAESAK